MQDNCNRIEQENETLGSEVTITQEKSVPNATLEEIGMLVNCCTLAFSKVLQYLRSVEKAFVNLKKVITADEAK